MGELKAGVVIKTKFVVDSSKTFTAYINYIDRESAVRNDNSFKFNAYQDYMDNPEKTSELFTAADDSVSQDKKEQLKKQFVQAQKNESLMWQTVISFDNRWLAQNGLYDPDTETLNEEKIKEYTRYSVDVLMEKENLKGTAVWSAAIHYNTDNVHIHIAMTEPIPTREQMMYMGKLQYRGKFKESSISSARSVMVNRILSQQKENQMIHDIIRKNILGEKQKKDLLCDKKLKDKMKQLYKSLPPDTRKWAYNMNAIKDLKPLIDSISKEYLKHYHKADLEELQKQLNSRQEKYQTAYGQKKHGSNQYAKNKMNDLYTRLGNAILSELKQHHKEVKAEYYRHLKNQNVQMKTTLKEYKNKANLTKSLNRLKHAFDKDFRHIKNQQIFQQFESDMDM